ncbi:MAG: hexosaminidase, partial [Polaribacter sp.]
AEVVWSTKENRNYKNFVKRLVHFNKRLDVMNVNYAKHLHEVKAQVLNDNGHLTLQLETTTDHKIIYSLDGKKPNYLVHSEYKRPIIIDSSITIKAAVFNTDKQQLGGVLKQKIKLHKAVGKKISLNVKPDKGYNTGGKKALINGVSGNNKRNGDKEWLGFSGDDVEIIIKFDSPTEINSIATRFFNKTNQWIYVPKTLNLELTLEDGSIISSKNTVKNDNSLLVNFNLNMAAFYPEDKILKTNKLKITIPNYGIIPPGKKGAGHKAWTFIDEIVIE